MGQFDFHNSRYFIIRTTCSHLFLGAINVKTLPRFGRNWQSRSTLKKTFGNMWYHKKSIQKLLWLKQIVALKKSYAWVNLRKIIKYLLKIHTHIIPLNFYPIYWYYWYYIQRVLFAGRFQHVVIWIRTLTKYAFSPKTKRTSLVGALNLKMMSDTGVPQKDGNMIKSQSGVFAMTCVLNKKVRMEFLQQNPSPNIIFHKQLY